MYRLYQTLTPFLITMTLGLLVYGLVNRTRLGHPVKVAAPIETELEILSVPDLDFPDAVKKAKFVGGTVRLQALFDSDGKVKNVRPYPMLPYGVPESEAGHGHYAGYTSAQTYEGFVKELPLGLTQLALEQVGKIEFIPKSVNGQPQGELVSVLVGFGYTESRYSAGCSAINVTLVNSNGTVWDGNIWTHRNRGCTMI